RTRTALVLLVIGVVLVTFPSWRPLIKARRFWLAIGFLALAAIAIGVVERGVVANFVLRGQGLPGLLSMTGRTTTWGQAVSQLEQQPLLGFGYYSGHRFTIGEVT